MPRLHVFFLFFLSCCFGVTAQEMFLRDNLMQAKPGDYIVTAQSRGYALLLIRSRTPSTLVIEEVSVPEARFPKGTESWRHWIADQAPGNTSWVAYEIDLNSGVMHRFYSYTKNSWCQIPAAENFLGTLLGLRLQPMSSSLRRRVGPLPREGETDRRPFWQPKLIVDGEEVSGVAFDAWRTRWPSDGSELSGKMIDVFLPKKGSGYPAYFPYWLQIGGVVGKAKVRIIDSGFDLKSPQHPLPSQERTPDV